MDWERGGKRGGRAFFMIETTDVGVCVGVCACARECA